MADWGWRQQASNQYSRESSALPFFMWVGMIGFQLQFPELSHTALMLPTHFLLPIYQPNQEKGGRMSCLPCSIPSLSGFSAVMSFPLSPSPSICCRPLVKTYRPAVTLRDVWTETLTWALHILSVAQKTKQNKTSLHMIHAAVILL